ncbi:MAG TPA: AsmA-like C-terminal region-containing protein [Rhodocyclaceae bacterium]|nr:AsmA-like C-terminal region-containing protein [Rhodocyclaceae bacterium]
MGPVQRFSWLRQHRRWVLLFLLPVVAVAAGEIAGWPFLRAPAEHLMTRQMERPVRIDAPFRIRFLGGLRLDAHGLWIAAPPQFDLPHFLDADDIHLRLRYGDLWHFRESDRLRIAVLDVGRLDARLLRDRNDASWRFGKEKKEEGPPALPVIDLLGVRQGTVVFRDPAQEADLDATFDTREGTDATKPATHLRVRGQFRGRPLAGELGSTGLLPATGQGAGTPPVSAQGWLTYGPVRADFEGSVRDLFGERDIAGKVTVKGPSLGILGQLVGATLPTTSPFSLQGRIGKEKDVWQADVDQARIGASDLAARFRYDPGAKPPRLEGTLSGAKLVFADLGPAFGTRSEEGTPVRRRPGHLIPDRPLDLPSLKNLQAHVTVNLDEVDLGKAFREPIRPFKATLTLEESRLGLAKVDARTAKGHLSGDISVDARQKNPQWHADLAWDGIRLEDWIRGAKARPAAAEGGRPPYFTGTLLGRAKLAGEGKSTAEVLASLDGEITLSVRNGSLSHLIIEVLGLDLAQGLGVALRGDEDLPMQCAVMDLQAKNGVIAPKVALIDTPVTLVLADGTVNLSRESLDLRLTAKPKNVSPFTVRSPIRVRGSFDDLKAAPESGPIAARVLGGVALAFVNPLAAILPFIDPGGAKGSPCAQALATLKR